MPIEVDFFKITTDLYKSFKKTQINITSEMIEHFYNKNRFEPFLVKKELYNCVIKLPFERGSLKATCSWCSVFSSFSAFSFSKTQKRPDILRVLINICR